MPDVALTFACALYDRTVPLYAGQVKPRGITLNYLVEDSPRSIFDRMGKDQAFDLSEMSGAELVLRQAAGGSPLIAIPVFLSRVFRHSFIFINRNAGIRGPKDLERKRIGVPLFTMSAALWIRGMLTEDYDVDLSAVEWVQGAVDHPGGHGNPTLPPGLRVARLRQNDPNRTLWELLVAGEIDAIFTATVPERFAEEPAVVRLFSNDGEAERAYFRRTGIFPIMHMVALRRATYDQHPFIARSLFDAFEQSKQRALAGMRETGAPRASLPLLHAYIDETRRLFGDDPFPYGIEPNRSALEALVRYLHRDGLIERPFPIEELFAM